MSRKEMALIAYLMIAKWCGLKFRCTVNKQDFQVYLFQFVRLEN